MTAKKPSAKKAHAPSTRQGAASETASAPIAKFTQCIDVHCVKCGHMVWHGRSHIGTVLSDKRSRTITVGWERRYFVRKYERYERRRTRIHAHNPDCLSAKVGQQVRIVETRPISKTKNFVVIEILGGGSV